MIRLTAPSSHKALAGFLLVLVGLTSCALPKKKVVQAAPTLYDWYDKSTTGPAAVKISLTERKAYISRGGKEVAWTSIASGVEGHSSPTGKFTVMEKVEKKESNLYGVMVNSSGNVVDWNAKAGRDPVPSGGHFVGAPMPYWMRLTGGGVGMHAGPIPNPGKPASHGCFRLPQDLAQQLFEVVDVGTPVTVTGVAP